MPVKWVPVKIEFVRDNGATETLFDILKTLVSQQKVQKYLDEISGNKQIQRANRRAKRFLKPYIAAESLHDPLGK